MTDPIPLARLDRKDGACLLLLLGFLVVLVLRGFDAAAPPYEDAAILMRYSEHLAQGHGIVWNVGEKPVDGATDFLFMVGLAAVRWLGPSIEMATRLIGIASHVLMCLVVYAGVRRLHGTPRWTALLSGAYVALGPGLAYVEAGFGTPTFGLFAATTWFLAHRIYRVGATNRTAVLFALSGLVLGLVRPEGVFLAGFMLLGLVLFRGWARSKRVVLTFLLVFGIPGAIYFFWRWSYFGHPLPNPYYIKGRGHIFPRHFVGGMLDLLRLTAPFVPLFLYAALAAVARLLFRGAQRTDSEGLGSPRELCFIFFPVLSFTVLGMLHEGLMDYLMRFQYCTFPILLMSWPVLLDRAVRDWRSPAAPDAARRPLGVAAIVVAFLVTLGYVRTTFSVRTPHRWGTLDVAQLLAEYPHDYTVAVTNAGQIPLFSGWRAIDVWGLNDHAIATQGLTEELLERERPEVIQFDANYTPLTRKDRVVVPLPWHRAMKVLEEYAVSRGYVLAACYGRSPFGGHYYYVRPDFPESQEIVQRIREMDYFLISGKCFDFGVFDPSRRTEAPAW